MRVLAAFIVCGLCAACGGPSADADARGDSDTSASAVLETDEASTDSDDPCGLLTWETSAAPLVLTWCTPCHSSALPPAQRGGAPVGVDFDDAEDVLEQANRVLARATGTEPTMPPAGGPSDAARDRLSAWISCANP